MRNCKRVHKDLLMLSISPFFWGYVFTVFFLLIYFFIHSLIFTEIDLQITCIPSQHASVSCKCPTRNNLLRKDMPNSVWLAIPSHTGYVDPTRVIVAMLFAYNKTEKVFQFLMTMVFGGVFSKLSCNF